MTTKWVLLRRPLLQSNTRALNQGREREYYGMRFDRGSQNFGFHMIAQSQLIADDRRRSQEIEHGSIFCDRLRSRSQDRRRSQKCVSIWSQTIADLLRSAICDPRSYGNQPVEFGSTPQGIIDSTEFRLARFSPAEDLRDLNIKVKKKKFELLNCTYSLSTFKSSFFM